MLTPIRDALLKQMVRDAALELYQWLMALPWEQWMSMLF